MNQPSPFEQFTPIQKAFIYRALVSYRNKLQTTNFSLSTYEHEIDDITLMLSLSGFQLEQIKDIILLLEQCMEVEDLSILPHFNQYVKDQNDKDNQSIFSNSVEQLISDMNVGRFL